MRSKAQVAFAFAALSILLTVIVAFLLSSPVNRAESFYISLVFLSLAEIVVWLMPVFFREQAWAIGSSVFGVVYAAGVSALLVCALAGWSWRVLLAAHLIWMTLWAFVIASGIGAGRHAAAAAGIDRSARTHWNEIQDQFARIRDGLSTLSLPPSAAVAAAAEGLGEDLHYSPAVCNSASAALETDIANCLAELNRMLASPSSEEFESVFRSRITCARQLIRRRADVLARTQGEA